MLSTRADCVLDIGCGQASLLEAARERWDTAKLIGFDIDPVNYSLKGKNLHIEFGDGLDPDLSKKILDNFGQIDVAVANPPYTHVDVNQKIISVLKQANMYDCIPRKVKKLPAEIVFLAQNLLVLKESGELGAILPASIISGENWKALREFLIHEKSIDKVIQLPDKAFNNTEAATFAVNFNNKRNNKNSISLVSLDDSKTIDVDTVSAIKRLDYFYHANKSCSLFSKVPDNLLLFRGNKSSKSLKQNFSDYLHTSALKDTFQTLSFKSFKYPEGTKTAKKGDFVVARVGSRCVGKAAFISEGEIEVSDCIAVLRNLDVGFYMPFFCSEKFHRNAVCNALGTGAKYLTFDIIKEALEFNEF